MFTTDDIRVGTVLVFRPTTESYKYFRITRVFLHKTEKDVASYSFSSPDHASFVFGRVAISWAGLDVGSVSESKMFIIDEEWATEFEMAKTLDGPWDKAQHICEIKHWHENCDILYQPVEPRTPKLDELD